MRYIYVITNLINQKTYIGKRDCKDISPENDKYMSSSYLLNGDRKKTYQGVFKKYGKENFKKDIIWQGECSLEEINELEKYYIWLAKAAGKAEYNIAKGGDGGNLGVTPWNKGKSLPMEMRKKISETNKQYCGEKHSQYGTHLSEETKRKISMSLTGKYRGANNKNFGKKRSEECIRNFVKSYKKLNLTGERHHNSKKVVCLNNGKVFSCMREAAEWGIKTSSAGICQCVKNKQFTCGFHPETNEKLKWRYYDENKDN